jgi:hypothetical protein
MITRHIRIAMEKPPNADLICNLCREVYELRDGSEPSCICDVCAQKAVPVLLAKLRREQQALHRLFNRHGR